MTIVAREADLSGRPREQNGINLSNSPAPSASVCQVYDAVPLFSMAPELFPMSQTHYVTAGLERRFHPFLISLVLNHPSYAMTQMGKPVYSPSADSSVRCDLGMNVLLKHQCRGSMSEILEPDGAQTSPLQEMRRGLTSAPVCQSDYPLRNRPSHGRSPRATLSSNLPITSSSSVLSVSASIFLTALLT